ncbi:MAG: hypothetical protein JJU28_15835 [Cyclobacteriaceae bacterium]|nr:hypothetical protein [Cyclobacteriaceae bacterium]
MLIVFTVSLLLRWLLFNSPESTKNEEETFSIIKKEKQMELAERWIHLDGNISSREIRMVMMVSAGHSRILEVLRDEEKGKQWNINAKRFHVENKDALSWLSFVEYQFPFPLSNRGCYLNHQAQFAGNLTVVRFTSGESDLFTKGQKLDIINGIQGKWVIEEFDDFSRLSYHVISVPDRSLPKWVVDPIVRKNLWATMERLKTTIESI